MGNSLRVALLSTHPIQYQAPWFRALSAEPGLEITVLFAHMPTADQQGVGFGVPFEWDLPLLTGYRSVQLENVARRPALSTFSGCDTPGVGTVLRRLGIQVLVVNGWHVKAYLQALLACRRSRVPCIVRGDSNALRPRPTWVRFIHHLLLRQYAAFLVVGRANRCFYLQNGVPESRLFAAPHCVDNNFFAERSSAARADRSRLREAWGIPQDAFVALFAGKLIDKKRPLDFVRAAAEARGTLEGAGVHVLFAGDGPLRLACEDLMQRVEQPGRILGFVNQTRMPDAYSVADALVLPSDYGETWGLVVNEAMACRLPVAVSDRVGCHLDLVRPGETGEVFPFGDVHRLAQVLATWAGSPERRVAVGENGHRLVQSYSIDALVRGTRAALQAVTRAA